MTLQAKDVTVGMIITSGVITITVSKIDIGYQKNGKETRTFYGNGSRSMGRGFKDADLGYTDHTVKSETFLKIK